jgi:hypothetical protein
MTRRGAVALLEADARTVAAAVAGELANCGQIEPVGAPAILATLTAHHVLERVDYPQTAFQFEHQQHQEYYAALDVRTRLLDLPGDDRDAIGGFTADYVNDLAWTELAREGARLERGGASGFRLRTASSSCRWRGCGLRCGGQQHRCEEGGGLGPHVDRV